MFLEGDPNAFHDVVYHSDAITHVDIEEAGTATDISSYCTCRPLPGGCYCIMLPLAARATTFHAETPTAARAAPPASHALLHLP